MAGLVTDWVWSRYIYMTASKKAGQAAVMSGVIMAMGAGITLAYIEKPINLLFAVLGGMTGTYISVRFSK